MPENQVGTLEAVGIELAKVFHPLQERVESGEIIILLAELGIEFPSSLANDTDFQNAVTGAADKVGEMPALVIELIDAIKAEQYDVAAEKSLALVQLISELATDIQTIANEIEANGPYTGIDSDELDDFVLNLAKNLIDYLIVNYLETSVPLFEVFLEFFGIIEETVVNEGSTNPLLPEVTRRNLRLDRIPKLLGDPGGLLSELYDWGDSSFNGRELFKKLEKIFNKFGWPAVYEDATPELDLLLATLQTRTSGSQKGVELVLDKALGGSFSTTFSQDKWSLEAGFDAELTPNTSVGIMPDGQITFEPPSASGIKLEGSVFLKWIAKDNATNQPLLLFGSTGGSRLEAKEISALLGADFVWTGGAANGTVTFEAELKDGKLVIKPGNPDGFLAKVLPPEGFTLDFDLLLGINSEKGVYFRGSGTLEVDVPVSISIGPITILNLTLGLSMGEQFAINLGADIRTVLGPFTAIVENMGMKLLLTFPENKDGNLGPVNLGIDFKPPNGIGMSLDAGVVKGGGYLLLDYDNGRYAGAIELEFSGLFGFTAIGIINTKFPDGSEGFSLLLLINVTFATPIVLGYNFYLAGIGGLIGLHRTMSTEAIRKGVKDGSISNILFPENVIANITKIISDLEAIFPAKQDQFFLGVMARITWNTPAILTIEAGLAIEFPNPVKIALIGVIRCVLPDPEKNILSLNVAFAGIIDFEKKLLSFDASIFDSRILTITLEGDMALRVSWGEQPDFLVSVGGFHPSYSPPAHLDLLPMKRITVNILSGNPNLVLTAYFALTTNTIQFGAALDFSFRVSSFGVYGNFGFDVLIQFSPFRFIANVRASVAVKLGSSTLFSIDLDFNLEGPSPWRAYGHASFSILFIKIKVKFDKTWGEERVNTLPSVDVLPLLLEELEKDTNWVSVASQTTELVTLSSVATAPNTVLIRAFGSLEVNQNVLPLDTTMERFGNYQPTDISRATIKRLTLNGVNYEDSDLTDLKNSFAPAAYKNMSDQDKLSSPSYEKQNSGVRLNATDALKFDYGINRIVEYEVIVSDYEEEELGLQQFDMDFFKPFISGGDVGKSFLSREKKKNRTFGDKRVTLAEEAYAVAWVNDMTNAHTDSLVFSSKSEADEYLRTEVSSDPSKRGKIQITPAFQLA